MPATRPAPTGVDEFAERLQRALQSHRPEAPADTDGPVDTAGGPDVQPAELLDEAPAAAAPVGTGDHLVRSGDCLSSIAKNTGHLWETIWEDAANTTLRETRKDPNVLATGDRLTIPALCEKSEPGQTEMRHRFVRVQQPTVFQLQLSDNGEPLASRPCVIEYDNGDSFPSATNSEGFLRCPMPSDARSAKLSVGEDDEQREYKLQFGKLEPIEFLVGVQQRLRNLGFYDGPDHAELDEDTRNAIRRYQQSNGIDPSGKPDAETRKELRDQHGS